jgi:hypothetical protein
VRAAVEESALPLSAAPLYIEPPLTLEEVRSTEKAVAAQRGSKEEQRSSAVLRT